MIRGQTEGWIGGMGVDLFNNKRTKAEVKEIYRRLVCTV
jgi:hypothetical protein